MKVAAVITTYNRLEKLKKTIERSLNEDLDYVVVVNNASTDGTKEWLDGLNNERLKIIHNKVNLGGAGGFYIGFKYVIENLSVDWIVCYDDDAYPSENIISLFKKIAFNLPSDVASIASAVYLTDEKISEMNRPSYNPFWHTKKLINTILKGRGGFHVDDEDYKKDNFIEIDASSFVGFFVRTKVVKEVGLPRKELFIYGDDILYCLEIRKKGFKHVFYPTIKFYHDSETLLNQKQIYNPIWKAYYTYRNGVEIYRYSSGLFFIPVLLVKTIKWFMNYRYYPNSRVYKKILWLSLIDGLTRNFSRSHEEILKL